MSFRDRVIECIDCSEQFVFCAGEQLFFQEKQFKNEPKRCKPCKEKRNRLARSGHSMQVAKRIETNLYCRKCGVLTSVPFRPTQGRPVLCRVCYWEARQAEMPAPSQALENRLTQ